MFSTRNADDARALFADVILPLSLPKALTYGVPIDMHDNIRAGMRVEVALGRNKLYSGIVSKLHHRRPEGYEVKPIRNILDDEPIVNERQLIFWEWIGKYYMATPGEVMNAALPAHLKLTGETRLQWMPQYEDVVFEWSDEAFPVADALELRKELTISEVRAVAGNKHFTAVINELLENEVVVIHDELETAYKPKTEKIINLRAEYRTDDKLHELFDSLSRAPKQLNLLMAYVELSTKYGAVKQKDLLERADATQAQIKSLADKGVFSIDEVPVDRLGLQKEQVAPEITFTSAQQKAYDELNKTLEEKKVVLLEGVTVAVKPCSTSIS